MNSGIRVLDTGILHVDPVSMPAWEPLCQAVSQGELAAACLPLPLAMELVAEGTDLALVMFTHRGGSAIACRRGLGRLKDFQGKSLLIPHRLSIQHMLVHKLLGDRHIDLGPPPGTTPNDVCAEEVPMPLMAEMVERDRDRDIAGFIAPGPFVTEAASRGGVRCFLRTNDLWKNHPCCGLFVRREQLKSADRVQQLVLILFQAAQVLDNALTRKEGPSRQIVSTAANFLGISPEDAASALTEGGICFSPELLIPDASPIATIQEYMIRAMDLLPGPVDLNHFISPEFARRALSELTR